MSIIKKEKNKILQDLKSTGFASSHVYFLLNDEEIRLFENNQSYFEAMKNSPQIKERIRRIKKGNPIKDKGKYYEIGQYEYLSRALTLNDASLVELYLCETFLDIAKEYLGQEPKIRNVLTWIHPENPNRTLTHSQKWHRDQEDDHNLRIWIYYSDIKEKNGPLKYIKESSTGMRNSFLWPNIENKKWSTHGYLNQDAKNKIPMEDVVTATGPIGTIFFVDTNGIHCGGSVEMGDRMQSMATYLKPSAYQIINGPLYNFNHNTEKVNNCDYSSEKYKKLKERQKRLLK